MTTIEGILAFVHPATLTGALVYAALFLGFGFIGALLIRKASQRALRRDAVDRMAVLILRPLLQAGLWAFLAVGYAHLIPGLRALGTALLAGVSVVGIVLGVAAQNTLGNAIAGLALLVYRPFQVGDRLQVQAPAGPETGVVESVTLGYTVLVTFDNRRVVLPNALAGAQTTVNLTSVEPRVLANVEVGIGYGSDVEKARAILLGLAADDPDVTEPMDCPLVELGSSSVSLRVRAWCRDSPAATRFEHRLYESAKKRFAEAGIEIPYPYSNVIVSQR